MEFLLSCMRFLPDLGSNNLKPRDRTRQYQLKSTPATGKRDRFRHISQARHCDAAQKWADAQKRKRILPANGGDHLGNEMNRNEGEQKSETRLNGKHCPDDRRFR